MKYLALIVFSRDMRILNRHDGAQKIWQKRKHLKNHFSFWEYNKFDGRCQPKTVMFLDRQNINLVLFRLWIGLLFSGSSPMLPLWSSITLTVANPDIYDLRYKTLQDLPTRSEHGLTLLQEQKLLLSYTRCTTENINPQSANYKNITPWIN